MDVGYKSGDKTFKNHLDGYNFMPFFKGEVAEGPRHEFFYFSDNADLMAVRYNAWKLSFKTIQGNLFTGKEGFDERTSGDQPAARSVGALPR
jgi:arylsulfatase A-like enzyme